MAESNANSGELYLRICRSLLFGIGKSLLKNLSQHVVKKMFQILIGGIESLAALRTAGDDDAVAALRHRWRIVNEGGPLVLRKFSLRIGNDFCFVHGDVGYGMQHPPNARHFECQQT